VNTNLSQKAVTLMKVKLLENVNNVILNNSVKLMVFQTLNSLEELMVNLMRKTWWKNFKLTDQLLLHLNLVMISCSIVQVSITHQMKIVGYLNTRPNQNGKRLTIPFYFTDGVKLNMEKSFGNFKTRGDLNGVKMVTLEWDEVLMIVLLKVLLKLPLQL